MNLVKIVVEVAKKFKGLEDDLLVAELLDVQLVEVVHSEIEQALRQACRQECRQEGAGSE